MGADTANQCGTVGSTPSEHTRMLLDALRRGTVGMLDGFLRALTHTGKGHVVDVLQGRAVPDNSPSTPSYLNEALGTHKVNWARSILTIPLFDFASRGKTDLSKLYVPLYLVHNKNDQTDLDTAEVRSERVIPTEMIFMDYDGSLAPNTVLIEGMPGSGKTTFTKAYMCDWCRSCSGKTQTPQGILTWKLILYVPVTKITSSVEDAIKSAIAVNPLMQADVYNLLQLYPAYCSVIFDGIDECRDERIRLQLAEYIEGSKMGQKPKVIVTARTYLCGLDAGLFQRHLRCDGFTEQQVISYIDQFFVNDKNKAAEIKQKVSITDQSLTNPLRLYMACLGIEKGLIDISSCDRLSSTKLFLSQEHLLLQREQKKLSPTQTVATDQLDVEFRKFTILTLQAMLRGERSLSPRMLQQAGIQDDSAVKVFLSKEYLFTLRGEEERWTYRHETLYEFLSARGVGFLPPDSKLCVLLYICAQKEFRNLMVLVIGLLGHSSDDMEAAEDKDTNEALIEDMLKVCLILQGLLDKQGIPEPERAKVKSTKDNIAALVKDQSVQLLIRTLCSPNATNLSATQTELKSRLCRSWTLVVDTFYGAVMREPSQVFFGMMEEERYCGIITHLTACIQECQRANLNIIQWVIPGHWRDMDGHGSLLEKDVYPVGDGRWVMVSYGIWQYGKARVFDAWSPDDAVYAWKELQESSRERQQQDEHEMTLREKHSISQHEDPTISQSQNDSSSFQSLEFRLPSPRESFRVWGTKGQAPQHCFGTEAWRRFFDTVVKETREFHLYLAAETPLLPLLEAVLMKLDDLRAAVRYEMEIWGGYITLEELTCWLKRYKVRVAFDRLQLRGIDVVSEDRVKAVLQQFETETVIDADTLYCKRPVSLT